MSLVCPLLELPVEVWTYMVLVAADRDLAGAFALVRTNKELWRSEAGQVVRYLHALQKEDLPRPLVLPSHPEYEADLLLQSPWPDLVSSSSASPGQVDLPPEYGKMHMSDCGRGITALAQPAAELLQWDVRRDSVEQVASIQCHPGANQKVHSWDVDLVEGVVVILYIDDEPVKTASPESGANISPFQSTDGLHLPGVRTKPLPAAPLLKLSVAVFDRRTGRERTEQRLSIERQSHIDDLHIEIVGHRILLRTKDCVEVRRWKHQAKMLDRGSYSTGGQKEWSVEWHRPATVFPVLCAHLFGDDVVMVLSQPTSSEHGTDWGSTIELYRFHQAQPKIADVLLPIRARTVKGMSFIKTGLGRHWRDNAGDAIVVVCVEGYIWQADLKSFLDLLFPQSALSFFGAGHLTLDVHWVRAHMYNCPLSARDTSPMSVSVTGWRIASVWTRALNSTLSGPPQQNGGSKAMYLRTLNTDPRRTDPLRHVSTREQRPDEPIYTMFTHQRFCTYCDHQLNKKLSIAGPEDVSVFIGGSRMLLTSPSQSKLMAL